MQTIFEKVEGANCGRGQAIIILDIGICFWVFPLQKSEKRQNEPLPEIFVYLIKQKRKKNLCPIPFLDFHTSNIDFTLRRQKSKIKNIIIIYCNKMKKTSFFN